MVRNYLKIAIRNILRFKLYSVINIAGLAVGMAACITIFAYVRGQQGFDSFQKRANRIYRINVNANLNGKRSNFAVTPPSLGPFLVRQFPQIERSVRINAIDMISSEGSPSLKCGDKVIRARRFILVDSSFFRVFSFKLLLGNPSTVLSSPFSVVLTQDAARKFFGNENPIGKVILYNNKFHFTVTGVVQNPPPNSTIRFDYLGSLTSLPVIDRRPGELRSNFESNFYTYLLLSKGTRVGEIDQQLQKVLSKYWDQRWKSWFAPRVYLESLRNLYWDNSLMYDIPVKGSRTSTMAFSLIALIVLLIACANFVNLSTARSLARSKEVGIRKVVGSQRKQLVTQFMIESSLVSFIAVLFAVVIVELVVPWVNRAVGTSVDISAFHHVATFLSVLGIWAVTGVLSGLIPAVYFSSFQPVETMKRSIGSGNAKERGSKFFIVFQFSAAIALILSTIIVARQYDLLRFSDLGFNKSNLIVLKYDISANGDYKPFEEKLLENPHIEGVAAGDAVPGGTFGVAPYFFRGASGIRNLQFYFAVVNQDYVPVLGMKMLAGRNFSLNNLKQKSFILNQAAAEKMGWTPQQAIGKQIGSTADSLNGQVVGVVRNFNFQPLRFKVEPLVVVGGNDVQMLVLRVSPENIGATLGFIKKTWQAMFPNSPMTFNFLDKSLDTLYRSEEKMGALFSWFSVLAVIVACLGLYGLALYTAERRTKEIGIRKVLGASVPGVIFALSKEFTEWVIVANIIAWPVAYFLMHNWLENFAYRTSISLWIFPLSGGIALVLALLTVGSHALRAARSNPVEALRYE